MRQARSKTQKPWPRRTPAILLVLLFSAPAVAETHHVTIRNGADETIRSVAMATAGSGRVGANRLSSRRLPPGAVARIAYSQGCMADIQIGYASGKIENHPGVEVCSDPRITTGNGVAMRPSNPIAAKAGPAAPEPAFAKPPLPSVPPWTGKSITKRFGGMD